MLAKSLLRICRPLFEIVLELQLLAKSPANFVCVSLRPFGGPNFASVFQDLFDGFCFHENAAVIVPEDHVVFGNLKLTELCELQSVVATRVQSLWSRWARTITKNRQPNLF